MPLIVQYHIVRSIVCTMLVLGLDPAASPLLAQHASDTSAIVTVHHDSLGTPLLTWPDTAGRSVSLHDQHASPDSDAKAMPSDGSVHPGPRARKEKRSRTNGSVEVGGTYGALPFTLPSSSAYNAFLRGRVSLSGSKLPIGLVFDLGTDQPVRGQRNSIRFQFEAPKLLEGDRWQQAHALHEAQLRLDSLQGLQQVHRRRLAGAEARAQALSEKAGALPVRAFPPMGIPTDTIPLSFPGQEPGPHSTSWDSEPPLSIDSLRSRILGLRGEQAQVDGLSGKAGAPAAPAFPFMDSLTGTMTPPYHASLALQANARYGGLSHSIDSLRSRIQELRARQAQLDSMVARQSQLVQREKALTAELGEKRGSLRQLAQGIRRLEFGSCSPNSSEFLLNGVNFQGISFEYAHKDLFLAFDHGRSFDDTWQNNDPVAQGLRRLHQSLFLRDAQDLDPRRFTTIRTGVGTPEGTHVHIGYLNGRRNDIPLGMSHASVSPLELTNHVIELDAGHVIRERHAIRIIYARSLTIGGVGMEDSGLGTRQTIGDLLSSSSAQNEAIKLKWTSELERTGTRIEAEARNIDRFFQSFGLGFIRNGSRAAELRGEQRIGKKIRLRSKAVLEERQLASVDDPGMALIQRGTFSATWSPTRALRLRAGADRSLIQMLTSTGRNTSTINHIWTGGASWRKRWRRTTCTFDADASHYDWWITGGRQGAMNLTAGFGIEQGDRWTIRCTHSSMARTDTDTLSSMNNSSILAGYRTRKGFGMEGSLQVAGDRQSGWRLAAHQRISGRSMIGVEGMRWARFSNHLSTIDDFFIVNPYTWKVSFQYSW